MAAKCKIAGCKGEVIDGSCPICHSADQEADGEETVVVGTGHPRSFAETPEKLHSDGSQHSISSGVSAHPRSLSSLAESQSLKHVARKESLSAATSSRRYNLGGEYVTIEPPPPVEPESLLKSNLTIPLAQRICSNPGCVDELGHPYNLVEKDAAGKPILVESGHCPKCGAAFSFEQLSAGTMVSGQYEIRGPLAIGGCGFVYLGWDVNVGRHVILKGLINSQDPLAVSAAIAERQFLANLRNPSVVSIINFVAHNNQSYLVEEFIDGISLKQLRERRGPLPVAEAISYALGMLPAFEYLHSRHPRILFCDGKLDNFMVQGNRLRMIDLGGARLEHDELADIYLTVGYCAPEAYTSPSLLSDLYTVGRCLAVMLARFDFMGKFVNSLPTPGEEPVFAAYESLYRFLLRATANDPSDRFQSAQEMAQQLWGVLREVAALDLQNPAPGDSVFFGADLSRDKNCLDYKLLPDLRIDRDDPAHTLVESALLLNHPLRRQAVLQEATQEYPGSQEVRLRIANCLIEAGAFEDASAQLKQLFETDPYDWRIAWLRGKQLLAENEAAEAFAFFDAVYSEIPGELAPKLALAVAAEMSSDFQCAIRFYDLVSRVDPGYTAAAFGLARCLARQQDKPGAVAAYDRVPRTSISYTHAVVGAVQTLLHPEPAEPNMQDFLHAAEALQSIAADNYLALKLQADLLLSALRQLEAGTLPKDGSLTLMSVPLVENDLRDRLETTLRQCARFADTESEREKLVDDANRVRRFTWF
jgi:serine/threonine-protein kinase PknG